MRGNQWATALGFVLIRVSEGDWEGEPKFTDTEMEGWLLVMDDRMKYTGRMSLGRKEPTAQT